MAAPEPVVEIAFDSGYLTPAASRTWTDVSDWVVYEAGVNITRGRQDEQSETNPSTLSLTLDNRDGRFTPHRAGSPYYPNVKVGRPIRVTVTPDGGVASVRFTGYVDEWPVEWDGTDGYAQVTVTASSRTARLGFNAELRSVVEEEILRHDPVAYYPMGEPEGATQAADLVGGPALVQRGRGDAVTFGTATGPGTDDLTAATFAGGKHLTNDTMPIDTNDTYSLLMAVVTSTSDRYLWGAYYPPTGLAQGHTLQLFITATGKVQAVRDSVNPAFDFSATGTTTVTDGALHTIVVTKAAVDGDISLYVDGVDQGIGGVAWDVLTTSWTLGNARDSGGDLLAPYVGTLAHFAFIGGGLSAADVAAFHDACATGYAGDAPSERLARYAAFAGVPASEQAFAGGSTSLTHVDTTGGSVVDLMQRVATTDGGVLFDARDGALTYQGRDSRYQAPVGLVLLADSHEIEADYSPKLDRSGLVNDVTATGGTVTVRAVDEASRSEYGNAATSLELMTDDETTIHGAAWWLVNTRSEPMLRTPTLSVNLLNLDTGRQADLLALDLSSRVTVTGLPSQAAAPTADYFVEGYTETIGHQSYTFTLNVSDGAAWLTTWVLDSPTRSQLDSTTTPAY